MGDCSVDLSRFIFLGRVLLCARVQQKWILSRMMKMCVNVEKTTHYAHFSRFPVKKKTQKTYILYRPK